MFAFVLFVVTIVTWLLIVLTGNDMREPPTQKLWRLLILAFVLNAVALIR